MTWFFLLVAAAAVAWVLRTRGMPRLLWPEQVEEDDDDTAPIVEPNSAGKRRTKNLFKAFRLDEDAVPSDADREDLRLFERALSLLADHVGASQAVLWRPGEGDQGLIPAAWCIGSSEPVLEEQERLLVELSASEQQATYNASAPTITILAVGVPLGEDRAAVSVHFREDPTMGRTALMEWTQRHARVVADLYEVARLRAGLARRASKLRATIRTAKTLQGTRDPLALENTLASDACTVTGADWAIVVRWDPNGRVATPSHISAAAPDFGASVIARPGSLVGDVCLGGGIKLFSDARPLLSSREPVFDGSPLPEGTLSLVVIPLQRSEQEAPIGAIVLGHSERGTLTQSDAHGARDLGTIAAGALETAWAVQDETLRARTDPLTALPNRRAFDEAFTRMIQETDRFGGTSALVMVDIDHFKQVNDSFGHKAGDEVLKVVGAALAAERRTTDFVARLGGEEFALLLPQTERQGALEVAERLRRRVENVRALTSAGEIDVTASFGVALYLQRTGSAAELYERADAALYAAKRGGRNRVELAGDSVAERPSDVSD